MLRLRFIVRTALFLVAVCAAGPALVQDTGDRIAAAEEKLDADIKACKPINPDEYRALKEEADSNRKKAESVAKLGAGAFVAEKKLDSEFKRADDLYKRAVQAAAKNPCPPPQQQSQPSTGEAKRGPTGPQTPRPGKAGKAARSSTLDDLFGPPPTPPKHSIVEDLVEPPTPGEVKILDGALKDLDGVGKEMKKGAGCDPKAWDEYINRLKLIAKRTRQMADWANTPGQTTGVDPKEAERVANEAQKQLDEAKKSAPADCPKTAPQPKEEPRPQTGKLDLPLGEPEAVPPKPRLTPAQQPQPAHGGALQPRIQEARLRFEAEKADCRPTDVEFYRRLRDEARSRLNAIDGTKNRPEFQKGLDDYYDAEAVFNGAYERCKLNPAKVVAGEAGESATPQPLPKANAGPNLPLGGRDPYAPQSSGRGPNLPLGGPNPYAPLVLPGTPDPYPPPQPGAYPSPRLIIDFPVQGNQNSNPNGNQPPSKPQDELQPKPKKTQPTETQPQQGPGDVP